MANFSRDEGKGALLHRCFYAVAFSEDVLNYLMGIIERLQGYRAGVGWTRRGNLHLTLRFLGEITDEQLAGAQEIPIPESVGPFVLQAKGLGAFPSLQQPRIFWAGIQGKEREDMEHLLSLQGATEKWARELGLAPENRRYSPHITLARVRRGDGVRELAEGVADTECESPFCRVGSLVLMKSTLTPEGPRYEVLERRPLG